MQPWSQPSARTNRKSPLPRELASSFQSAGLVAEQKTSPARLRSDGGNVWLEAGDRDSRIPLPAWCPGTVTGFFFRAASECGRWSEFPPQNSTSAPQRETDKEATSPACHLPDPPGRGHGPRSTIHHHVWRPCRSLISHGKSSCAAARTSVVTDSTSASVVR